MVATMTGGFLFFKTLKWYGKAKNPKDAKKQASEMAEFVGFKVVKFLFTKRNK